MSARVIVSMLAATIGRRSVTPLVKRVVRSMTAGSRLGTTPNRGVSRKASNVQPRTTSSKSIAFLESALILPYHRLPLWCAKMTGFPRILSREQVPATGPTLAYNRASVSDF